MSITRQATSPSWEFDVATSFCAAEVFFVMSKKPGARSFLATGGSAEMLAECSTPSGRVSARLHSTCCFISQSSKLTDVSHHKGELSFVSKLRLQLMYDLPELGHKICGIIFHSENSNIITYQRSRSNSFFAFKVTDSSRGLSRKIRKIFAKNSQKIREKFAKN